MYAKDGQPGDEDEDEEEEGGKHGRDPHVVEFAVGMRMPRTGSLRMARRGSLQRKGQCDL